MRAKWMGVAVAAAVVCEWAGGANALTLSITGQVPYDEGAISQSIYINTTTHIGTFGIYKYDSGMFGTFIDSISGTGHLSILTVDVRPTYGYSISGTITTENATFFDTTDGITGDGTTTYGPYTYKFSFGGDFIAYNSQSLNDLPLINQVSIANLYAYAPLPSSAPLFGAALLALGGGAYARRRVVGRKAA